MSRRRKAWLWGGDGRRFDSGRRQPGYYVRYYTYATGRRQNHTKHFLKQQLARRWVSKFNAQHDLNLIGDIAVVSMEEAMAEFLEGCSSLNKSTRGNYEDAIGKLYGIVGNVPVSRVTGRNIDEFVSRRYSDVAKNSPKGQPRRVSEATVARHIRSLRRFFVWAIKRKYANSNPVNEATVLPNQRSVRNRPAISEAQLTKLINAIDTEDRKIAVWLAMTTGLDRGVIRGLCTAQINREDNVIHLQRPKTRRTKASVLSVPVHCELAPLLYARLRESEPYHPILSGLHRQNDQKDWWKRAKESAGVPDLMFRDLRAVASSRPMKLAGASLRSVQHLLGHKSILTTAGHYHIPDPEIVQAVNSLPLPGLHKTS